MRSSLVVVVLLVAGLTGCSSSGTPKSSETIAGPGQHVFVIRGENMAKTLHGCGVDSTPDCVPDRVAFDLLSGTNGRVHDGDIVAFRAPRGWIDSPGVTLVSRVIAVGGETVKGDAHGRVMISQHGKDGPYRTLDEPYVFVDQGTGGTVRAFGPITVPKNRLWLMGDHRNDSADSRYHCGPGGSDGPTDASCDAQASTVPVASAIGVADRIISPPDRAGSLK